MGIKNALKRAFFEATAGYFPRRKLRKYIVKKASENNPKKYGKDSGRYYDLEYIADLIAEFVILKKCTPEYVISIVSDITALDLTEFY